MTEQPGITIEEYLDDREARIQAHMAQADIEHTNNLKRHGSKPCVCGAEQIPIGSYKYCPICMVQAKAREKIKQNEYRAKNRDRDRAYQIEYRKRKGKRIRKPTKPVPAPELK